MKEAFRGDTDEEVYESAELEALEKDTDEYYKKVKDEFTKGGKESNNVQPVVDHIDKSDETIMEMMTSPCGRFLLMNIRKPWLELWDLTKVPHPKCVQRFYGY